MPQHARAYPVTTGIGLVAIGMALSVGLIQHQRNTGRADFINAKPLTVMSAAPRNEADIRDRDIEFYTKRIREDRRSAADHVVLAGMLFTRSRNTGSTADLDSALQLARESVDERSQRNDQAFSLLASLLMAKHEFREARTVAQRIDSIDPGNPSHLALLGEIELELGNYTAAATHFGAINYDGRNFTNGARLARWYEVTGHNDLARHYLQQAIVDVDRRDDLPADQAAWFHYRLGDLELRSGNVAAADSQFVIGLAKHPDDVRVLGGLARAALMSGEWQKAVDFGERATAVQLDPATLGTVSLAYSRLGDTAQAASYARAMSVSALKQPGVIHRAWGLFILDHGSAQDRADVLRRARLELRIRKDVYGHDIMAWALYRNGKLAEARQEMKLAMSQHTQDVLLAEHARAIGL